MTKQYLRLGSPANVIVMLSAEIAADLLVRPIIGRHIRQGRSCGRGRLVLAEVAVADRSSPKVCYALPLCIHELTVVRMYISGATIAGTAGRPVVNPLDRVPCPI